MTEAELQAEVERQLGRAGFLWHHCTRPQTCRGTAGFPDLIAAHQSAVLVAELKSDDGRRSLDQIKWADRFARAGLAYRLWRPDDLRSGTIAAELRKFR